MTMRSTTTSKLKTMMTMTSMTTMNSMSRRTRWWLISSSASSSSSSLSTRSLATHTSILAPISTMTLSPTMMFLPIVGQRRRQHRQQQDRHHRCQEQNPLTSFTLPSCRRHYFSSSSSSSSFSSYSSSSSSSLPRQHHKGDGNDSSNNNKHRLTTVRLYRILLRTVRSMMMTTVADATTTTMTTTAAAASRQSRRTTMHNLMLLQPPLDPHGWGRHSTFSVDSQYSKKDLQPQARYLMELYRLFFVWNYKNNNVSTGIVVDNDGFDHNDDDEDDELDHEDDDTFASNDSWYYMLTNTMVTSGHHHQKRNNIGIKLPPLQSQTIWTTPYDVECAIRIAFKTKYGNNITGSGDSIKSSTKKKTGGNDDDNYHNTTPVSIKDLHSYAIYANQLLREQAILWKNSSTVETKGLVRVTATSQCIEQGTTVESLFPPSISTTARSAPPLTSSNSKYRYAYRIRVENISGSHSNNRTSSNESQDEDGQDRDGRTMATTSTSPPPPPPPTTVQLVGRCWHISELGHHRTDDGRDSSVTLPPPIEVNAPYTGAVGQLPVLKPGEVFEYMSGTELGSPRGVMKGHLYMAVVPDTTVSAKSGDEVDALKFASSSSLQAMAQAESQQLEEQIFEATVAPFPLDGR